MPKPPCETVVKKYLSVLRSSIIQDLQGSSHTQAEIADLLGITQAAVSSYLKKLEKVTLPESMEESIKQFSTTISNKIREESATDLEVLQEICDYCKIMRQAGGLFCRLHQQESTSLSDSCEICRGTNIDPHLNAERKDILTELEKAIHLLQLEENLYQLIPEVQSNLVMALKGAKIREEVAGFPGRIVKVKNKVRVLAPPEFGASGHTADILLSILDLNPTFQACMCVKFDERIEYTIKTLLGGYLEYTLADPKKMPQFTTNEMMSYSQEHYLAVVEKGLVGIEPVTYIFGNDAQDVINFVIRLAKEYNKNP